MPPDGVDTTRPVPFRGGGFRTRSIFVVGPIVFVLLILLWQLGSGTGFISDIALPAPSAVFDAFRDLVTTGLFSLARAGLVPVVSAAFPIPKIALLPLFVIWFGTGEGSKVATILFGTLFPTVVATYGGIDNVDRNLIRMGQSFGLTWLSIVRKIVIPGALPAILSGFRISASIAVVLLVAAEMIGAQYGIGAYILTAGALFATDQLIAGVAILSILGLAIGWLIGRAERRFLDWRT